MSITMSDVDSLPTIQDDERVQTLESNLDALADEFHDLEDTLPEARAAAEDAEEAAEDAEIEQYADPDMTEKDVAKAQKTATKAREKVKEMERRHEKLEEAIGRVQERLKEERRAAAVRLYPKRKPYIREAAQQVLDAAPAFMEAVKVFNAVRGSVPGRKPTHEELPDAPNYPRQILGKPRKKTSGTRHIAETIESLQNAVERLDDAA